MFDNRCLPTHEVSGLLVIVMLKSAAGGRVWREGVRASTFGFRSITLVYFGLLTPNLLYG